MVKLLVEYGADVNCYAQPLGNTIFPLQYSILRAGEDCNGCNIVKYLLENIPSIPSGRDFKVHSHIFLTAVRSKNNGLELINLLHPHRLPIEMPAYRLVYGNLLANSATVEIAEFLIDNDYPIEWNTLCKLCEKSDRATLNLEIVKLLCEKRIDIIHNIEAGATSRSLLNYAVGILSFDIAKLLLEYGFDPNGRSRALLSHSMHVIPWHLNPLVTLVEYASEEMDDVTLDQIVDMMRTLARYGVNFLVTKDNETSLYDEVRHMEVYNVLLENGAVLHKNDRMYIQASLRLDASNLATRTYSVYRCSCASLMVCVALTFCLFTSISPHNNLYITLYSCTSHTPLDSNREHATFAEISTTSKSSVHISYRRSPTWRINEIHDR